MPAGRPTEYTTKILKKAKAFLKRALEAQNQEKTLLTPPNMAQFALELGIARKTIYNWAKEHEEFLHITEQIQAIQENMLLDRGLTGEYNATITKLMLTKHGYTDKADITSDGKALPTPILGHVPSNNSNTEGDEPSETN